MYFWNFNDKRLGEMKKLINGLLVVSVLFYGSSCKYSKLAQYYNSNLELHKSIADSLYNFIQNHDTKVIMRQKFYGDKKVSFGYYFSDINTVIGIGYDSLFNRDNPYPERTAKINIPLKLIKDFKKTIYHAILATKEGIFFGYDYYSSSDYEYGLLVYYDESKIQKTDVIKKLDNGACIYKKIIP